MKRGKSATVMQPRTYKEITTIWIFQGRLQDEDPMIQDFKKRNPDVTVEQHGLWYHLRKPKQPEKIVEQLLLPKQYHQIVCKLAHTIPLAGHLGRDQTTKRNTRHFY